MECGYNYLYQRSMRLQLVAFWLPLLFGHDLRQFQQPPSNKFLQGIRQLASSPPWLSYNRRPNYPQQLYHWLLGELLLNYRSSK